MFLPLLTSTAFKPTGSPFLFPFISRLRLAPLKKKKMLAVSVKAYGNDKKFS